MKPLLLPLLLCLPFSLVLAQPALTPPGQKLKRADCFFGVHFDLHASEDITDAGRTLSYEMIDSFITRVRPDFIQIDCKGHPGISSYPTRVGYHVKGFEKDPLALWRKVTGERNVALFMHYSGVWDSKVATEHIPWAIVNPDGTPGRQKLSFFSPYSDSLLIPQLKELSDYGVDGAWIDGECWAVEPDYSQASLDRFRKETGITEIPLSAESMYYPDFLEFTRRMFREYLRHYVDAIHRYNPDFQITSNWAYSSMMPEPVLADLDFLSGDVTPLNGVYRSAFEARCLAAQGKPWDLMAWGFSWNGGEMPMSIKPAVQLKQEAAQIMAMGGGVQFYYQQNRDLSIKPWIAGPLQDIAGFCRERQVYCHKSTPIPQVALLYPSAWYQKNAARPYSYGTPELEGMLNVLLDGQFSVEILMEHSLEGKMDSYPLIVVPECGFLNPDILYQLKTYVEKGGNLLLTGTELIPAFTEELGLNKLELRPEELIFFETGGALACTRSATGVPVPAASLKPLSYFYNSSDFRDKSPRIAASVNAYGKGRVAGIYFNAGSAYREYKTPMIRDFVGSVVKELFPVPTVTLSGSRLIHLSLNSKNGNMYVNLVNIAGEHTNPAAIAYDEIPPLRDIKVSLHLPRKPSSITLQPGAIPVKYSYEEGLAVFTLPEIRIHTVVEIVP